MGLGARLLRAAPGVKEPPSRTEYGRTPRANGRMVGCRRDGMHRKAPLQVEHSKEVHTALVEEAAASAARGRLTFGLDDRLNERHRARCRLGVASVRSVVRSAARRSGQPHPQGCLAFVAIERGGEIGGGELGALRHLVLDCDDGEHRQACGALAHTDVLDDDRLERREVELADRGGELAAMYDLRELAKVDGTWKVRVGPPGGEATRRCGHPGAFEGGGRGEASGWALGARSGGAGHAPERSRSMASKRARASACVYSVYGGLLAE